MLLSVITINYNDAKGLQKTFNSVFQQVFKDFEYIVIDGGSTDGSQGLIDENRHRIAYAISEKDKGVYDAMNKGIAAAKGEYVVFINSGDELYSPDTLKTLAESSESGEGIIYGKIEVAWPDGKRMIKETPQHLRFSHFINDTISHPGSMIRRDLFHTLGFYDENLKISSDWKWFLAAICKHNVKNKRIDTLTARFYFDGLSSDTANLHVIEKEKSDVLNADYGHFLDDVQELFAARVSVQNVKSSRAIKYLKKLGLCKQL